MGLKAIDAVTLKRWLENGEAVLVDVREPGEHAAQSIAGTKLVPLASVCKKALPECNGKKLVVHCMKGGRGNSACAKLLAEDPNLEIYNLEGGISSWCEAGLEVNKASKGFFLPLDRQVQLTIGLGVLIGSILAYTVSPVFILLAGFFGAGLTVAGITGFCGLAVLMAKMPWNQCRKVLS